MSTSPEGKLSIKIADIHKLCTYLHQALKIKAFTEDEVKEIYPVWNEVYKFCDEIKRRSEIEEAYKKEKEEKALPTVEEENTEEVKKVEEKQD